MENDSLLYQIALPLLPEVGTTIARELICRLGSAEEVFSVKKADLMNLHGIGERSAEHIISGREAAIERAKKEVEWIHKHEIQTYYFEDDNYPADLREIPDAPILLYGKGNMTLNKGHYLAIVGTRSPSDRGRQLTQELVKDLAQRVPDLCIVSGLAYGIDVAAHKAAIEAGLQTIIVPGHGLDRIYPAANRNVAVEALSNGGILTEYMSGTEPMPQNFVARNRIVAGMSEATVVVESKAKGGSLITAELAFGYSRDVFAFPGRTTDVVSAGCNQLIRKNIAGLISSADDLIASLGWETNEPRQTALNFVELSADEQTVMDALRQHEDGVHINTLTQETGISFTSMTVILFNLELNNLVRALPGSQYRAL